MRNALPCLRLLLWLSFFLFMLPSPSAASLVSAPQDSTQVVEDTTQVIQAVDSLPLSSPVEPLEEATEVVRDPPTNPFADFQTHRLPNGVKLWIRALPGATNTSVSVGVPFGADSDPVGKEGTAHLLEHMLFSDHDGRTEQAIKEDIEGRGGRRNGFTTADQTWYYATVEREQGLFALEWLSRIVSPHSMEGDLVERNRQPVALELGAQPREIFDHLWALLSPAWLRPPGFWEREFGLATTGDRAFDRYRSLQAIEPRDLHEFYDQYYAPGAMTVTVVGDVDPEEVIALADSTFGLLRQRSVPESVRPLEDPARLSARHYWSFGPSVSHRIRFKVFQPSGSDDADLMFLQRLLARRLNQRLRYGEEKAVYTLQVQYVKRGPAAYLSVAGAIDPEEYEFALRVLEEELEAIRSGSLSDETFDTDRRAVVEQLRGANQTAEALNFWTFRRLSDPRLHDDFPDLLTRFENTSKAQLADLASRTLVPERQVLSVTRPHPVGQLTFAAAALLTFWLALRLVGWGLTRKVNLREIRYIARMKVSPMYKVALVTGAGAGAAFIGRVLYRGLEWIALNYVVVQGGYEIQMASFLGMGVFALTLGILLISLIPGKVLLFPDAILIKSLTFRSRKLEPDDIEYVTWARFPAIWLSRRILGVTPLLLGILRKGIYLKPKSGRAYFFQTRNSQELMELLEEWKPGITIERIPTPTPAPAPPSATPSPTPDAPPAKAPRGNSKTKEKEAPPKPSLDDIDIDSELSAEDLAALGIEAPEPEPDPFADLEDMIRDMDAESDTSKE